MKAPLDLFGQVPISRLEVKKKCKVMTGSTENIILEIMLEKIARASGLKYELSNHKKIRREAIEEELSIRLLQAERFYGTMCKTGLHYQEQVRNLKSMAKRSFEPPIEHEKHALRQKRRALCEARALEIIAEAEYRKKLTVAQIRLLHKLGINRMLIPWHCASEKGKIVGMELGIYMEQNLDNVLPKRFIDY